jgi:hypothetical protein
MGCQDECTTLGCPEHCAGATAVHPQGRVEPGHGRFHMVPTCPYFPELEGGHAACASERGLVEGSAPHEQHVCSTSSPFSSTQVVVFLSVFLLISLGLTSLANLSNPKHNTPTRLCSRFSSLAISLKDKGTISFQMSASCGKGQSVFFSFNKRQPKS